MNIFRKLLVLFLLMNFVYVSRGESKYIVTDFGAVPGGKVLNTKAIQKAIDLASANGGGVVVIPSGTFLIGCIKLKDQVELHLEEDAVLLGSTNPQDYFKAESDGTPRSPKTDDNSELGLILAVNATNISLTGEGTIDGQGLALALACDSLHHAGILLDPNYNYRRMRPSELVRPKLFRFLECNGITISKLTLKSSASWGLSFDLCRNMKMDSLTIINRAYWNNDGMDITDCVNVRVTNCNVNAADDGICLKSYHPGQANDSIYITNCTIRSSASAMKFGTGSYGGFKNVTIENIKVFDTFRSAIAIESVDGALIENIRVNNIVAENTGNAIFIRLGHRDGEKPGTVRNIQISNVKVQVPFGRPDIDYDLRGPEVDFFHNPFPASVAGIPGHNIENVVLENIEITYPGRATKGMAYIPVTDLERVPEKIENYPEFSMFGELPAWGFYVRHVNGIQFKNISLKLDDLDYRPAFVFDDVHTVAIDNLELSGAGTHPQIVLKGVQDANMQIPENQIQTIQ